MVSLTDRLIYVEELRRNPKANLFYNFVNDLPLPEDLDTAISTDKVILEAAKAIQANDKTNFDSGVANLIGREPKSNSPFANDDMLFFILLGGILKFNSESTWLRKILQIRATNDQESTQIKSTFQNILDRNFVHTGNAYQMVMPFEPLLEKSLLTHTERLKLFQQLTNSTFPPYKSDFLNILSLKCYDRILFENNPGPEGPIFRYIQFEKIFLKRIDVIAKIVYALIVLTALSYIIKFCLSTKYIAELNKLVSVFGLVGFGALSFFKRKWVIDALRKALKLLFGYYN